MKYAQEIFPKGTFKDQETDGAYIDETLATNLDVIAKKIADDMHFMGLISGHDMVRDGKTTLLTQVGTYLTWKINQLHGTNNTFTEKNLVFKGSKLESTSIALPKLSVIGLDEGDDLTTHGMKELAVKLKRYFRKCGQLNQILILILPSFFELPKFYALSRSHFLIDVFFAGEYERGFFKFYSPKNKKLLYLKGKREWDYSAQREDFKGRFFGSYCFFPDLQGCIARYKQRKYEDLVNDGDDSEEEKTPKQIEKEVIIRLFRQLYQNLEGISIAKLSKAFGFTDRTGFSYLHKGIIKENPTYSHETGSTEQIINNLIKEEDRGQDGTTN